MRTRFAPSLVAILLASALVQADDAVPLPSETPADVIVSGRTSTARSIKIVKVGQNIPKTHSGAKVKNIPGYTWYVSQHFALRSEAPEAESRQYLLVSELAYPHAAWVLSGEPPNMATTRLALSYSKNLDSLKKATQIDLGGVGWLGGGGGVTLNANACAYNYPSGGLRYHKRDLVIHENLHAMQMAMFGAGGVPHRFGEGITHAFANHVYDDARRRLTVCVVDKPTVNNPYDTGLRELREKPKTLDALIDGPCTGSEGMVYTQFCWTDPDRLMKWRLWRDELLRLHLEGQALKDADRRLMKEIFGPLDAVNATWEAWLKPRRSTFHYIAWGWEQSADTLWSYGYGKHPFSRTDINATPAERARYAPLRMDYPAEPVSAIVGPVKRGIPEPIIACVVDFSQAPSAGRAGLGLGVDGTKMMTVLIEKEREVVVDAKALGGRRHAFPLPQPVRQAAQKTGRRYGITLTLATGALEIVVRAGAQGTMKETRCSAPLTAPIRKLLLACKMAIIAKDGRHGVTAYFDDARKLPDVDLSQPAPIGRWRFAGDEDLYRLYRVAYRLKAKTPPSLLALRKTLADAMDKDAKTQTAALAAWREQSPKVMKDLFALERDANVEQAISELTGVSMHVDLADDATWSRPRFVLRIRGASDRPIAGAVSLTASPAGEFEQAAFSKKLTIGKDEWAAVPWAPARRVSTLTPFAVHATATLAWGDIPIRLSARRGPQFSIPCYWVIGPFRNEGPKGGGIADIAHPPEKDAFDTSRIYTTAGKKIPGWQPTELATVPVRWSQLVAEGGAPLAKEFYVDFMALYGHTPGLPRPPKATAAANNCAAYALVWVESPKDQDVTLLAGAEDGLMVWLNGTLVHKHLAHRDYQYGSDRAPLHLKKGKNKLALKITRGQWGNAWGFSACLIGEDGLPLQGLKYGLR